MLEWLLKISSWIWDNISNIDSIVSIITTLLSGGVFIGGVVYGIIASILRLKLKRNQYKYLNLVVDNQTKQSMKYYIPTRGQDIDPNTEEDSQSMITKELVPFFVDEIFNKSDAQYFIILADSGMGKTTFLLHLFFKYYKRIFRKFDIVFIPLALHCSIEKIREVNKKSMTVLLLDGFDEDQYAVKDYVNRLIEICNETELFYKVIITCRTQFFSDCDSEPKYVGRKIKFGIGKKSVVFEKYYISPFNNKEVDLYLKKKYNSIFEREKIKRSKKIIANCPKLMVRPMLLEFVDDLIIDETKSYDYAYEIYGALISKWIEREPIKDEYLYSFCEKVALSMWCKTRNYIREDEIEDLCRKYNIQIAKNETKSKSLLNRDADGNYKFAHKSFLEFFLAKIAYKNFKFRRMVMLSKNKSIGMLAYFLREMDIVHLKELSRKDCPDMIDISFTYSQLSCTILREFKIINCCFEGSDMHSTKFIGIVFDKVNLVKVDLSNADLTKAIFYDVDMAHANLEGANLKDTILIGADLKNAKLYKANLEGSDLRGAKFYHADLTGVDLSNSICNREQFIGAYYEGIELRKEYYNNSNLFIDERYIGNKATEKHYKFLKENGFLQEITYIRFDDKFS